MNTARVSPRGTHRVTAAIVGVLYITGTVAGILSAVLTTPILDGSGFLTNIAANEVQFVTAALFVLLMGLALAMVPVMMYPILRKHNQALALGYVVFRGALETVTYIAWVIAWLFLAIAGRDYVAVGPPDASYLQALGTLLKEGSDSISAITGIVFSVGALMLYYVFYVSKLIPRWISGWGVFAVILGLAATFLVIFHLQSYSDDINTVMHLPLLFQEMVMAVWLIAKGFSDAPAGRPGRAVFPTAAGTAS